MRRADHYNMRMITMIAVAVDAVSFEIASGGGIGGMKAIAGGRICGFGFRVTLEMSSLCGTFHPKPINAKNCIGHAHLQV